MVSKILKGLSLGNALVLTVIFVDAMANLKGGLVIFCWIGIFITSIVYAMLE